MRNFLWNLLLKILLTGLIGVNGLAHAIPLGLPNALDIANNEADMIFVKPSDLVMKDSEDKPLRYQFIIDYPHAPVPGNHYLKPWNTVSSNFINVKTMENHQNRILQKKNILYLFKGESDRIQSSTIK
ncbi:uncharacterized protein LOC142230369 [Haematobia irritans]|uniref:uncharacterized protein LOC142230369 n=1 Tax=Haematobia irritans TaxID=7368 RepID=UPI003F4FE62A